MNLVLIWLGRARWKYGWIDCIAKAFGIPVGVARIIMTLISALYVSQA